MGYSFLDKKNLKRGRPISGLRYIILYKHRRFTINYASRATTTTTTTTITPLSSPTPTPTTTTTSLPSPTQH